MMAKKKKAAKSQPMNFYVRLVIVLLLLYGLAQFIPEAVNTFLLIVLVSMILMNPETISREIARLSQ